MAEVNKEKSAARLASLKKCAADNRSATRLEALKKCAERGFTKVSEDRSILRRLALMKCAGIATDYLATVPTAVASNIPVLGLPISLAGMGGTAAGLLRETKGDENPKTEGKNLIPGVGSYRLAQRIRRVADQSDRAGAKGTRNLLAEVLGGLTAPIVGAGVGGLAGLGISAATGSNKGVGAGIGAGAGAALPQLIGALAAAVTKRRSRKEQTASDTSGRATAKYLVPGLGVYDYLKRLGASGNNDPQKA